jgi:hypothetical protein
MLDQKSNILEGNAFLNWKRKVINYNGLEYHVHVKAFVCNIAADSVGYAIKFPDKTWYIAKIDNKWVRLDIENDLAKAFGDEIDIHVYKVKKQVLDEKHAEWKEKRKKK